MRAFYEARRANDPEALRPWLAPDVRWSEPVVGEHMGLLIGPDAVIDMLRRALATTGGSFSLRVVETIETGRHCAAIIEWQAEKEGRLIRGREMAVYGFSDGGSSGVRIREASFFAANLEDDAAFWA
ncbi:nuclear transport factor 2 family protein [Roseomonas sp. GC11]|uniref:nuclear transport factor 2 family protein n=1 Tax=Roseomonas sp. GC11 TaxID=2950546 RepID=UPI00210A2BD9|nr:nuclear transport factor 2 family protein [Roseomonas sp. GC11]